MCCLMLPWQASAESTKREAHEQVQADYARLAGKWQRADGGYVLELKEAKPDAVMMGHWGNDAINALKQVYELGLRKESKIFFNSIGYTLSSGVPADALDGVTMGRWWYHDLSGLKDPATESAVNEFAKKYLAEFGDIPDTFAMYTYLAMMETLRGVQTSNSTDPARGTYK